MGIVEMSPGSYLSLLYRPEAGRELAAKKPVISAVINNAMFGILALASVSPQMLQMFTPSLVVIVILLFGPLAGFIVSSLYTRVEMTVGKRLGGMASLDELYRLFAWSFLPVGLVAAINSLIIYTLKKPSATTELVAAIPFLIILCCAIRNYCLNIIFVQHFTRVRGVVSIFLTFILFVVLVVGGLGFLSFLFSYEMGDCVKSMVTQ